MANDAEIERLLKSFARSARGAQVRDAIRMPCPSEATLANWRSLAWSDSEETLSVARHVLGCAQCAHRVSAESASVQVTPHPSLAMLVCHATGRLPTGPLGGVFYQRISEHLAGCEVCCGKARAIVDGVIELAKPAVIQEEQKDLQKMLRALTAMAYMREASNRWVASTRSVRREAKRTGAGQTIEALVIDSKGEVALDRKGEIVPAVFAVSEASVGPDHRLTIELHTRDRRLLGQKVAPLVDLMLVTPDRSLRLPRKPLTAPGGHTPYPVAQVSYRHNFAEAAQVAGLPATAFCITVTCRDQNEKEFL